MVSSQDTAVAVALQELGYDVTPRARGHSRDRRTRPPTAQLEVARRDARRSTARRVTDHRGGSVQAVDQRRRAGRAGRRSRCCATASEMTSRRSRRGATDGRARTIGFARSASSRLRLPVRRSRSTSTRDIGGPERRADVLARPSTTRSRPGSLTGGAVVAGTGRSPPDGTVGPIGGIQQKIVGARERRRRAVPRARRQLRRRARAPTTATCELVRVATIDERASTRSRPGPRTTTPTCPSCADAAIAVMTRQLDRASTSTRPSRPRSSRSSRTSPTSGWDQPAPALRAGRHRRAGARASPSWPPRWGSTTRRPRAR